MVLSTDKSILACTVLQAWGGGGGGGGRGGCLTEARSHSALVFFLLFLALAAALFSRAGRFEQFW